MLQDKYEFVQTAPATQIVLGPSNVGGPLARCEINFTVRVLKAQTIDARGDPGIQNNELAGANGTATDGQTGQGKGTNFTTVNLAQTTIVTQAVTPVTIGTAISDTATVSGRVSQTAIGTVTFTLFGQNDQTCAGQTIFT